MGNIDQPDFTDTYNLVPRASRSQLDSLYEDLPILVIDDWQELTEEFLEEKYGEITSRTYDIAKLYMEYWQRKIIQVRDNFLCKKSFQNDTLSIKKTKVYKDVELDHDQVEAHKVLKQIIDSDFLDKTFLDKLDFQTTPIQKIKSQGDINYYLLKCAYEQNEFLIDYYHLHDEPGEVVVIVQTDHTGKILSKIAIHIATTIIIDAQQEKIAYIANFLVKDEYCGLGYGGKLFKEAMTLIESYNAERAILKVKGGGSNHPALKIYERYGFQHDPKSPTEKYLMYKVLKAHN